MEGTRWHSAWLALHFGAIASPGRCKTRWKHGLRKHLLLLVQVEFEVLPRVLPRVQSFSMRVDSSLGEGKVVSADVADALASEAMSAAAEEGNSAVDVCLRMLPRVQEAAAQQFPGQVIHALGMYPSSEFHSGCYCSCMADVLLWCVVKKIAVSATRHTSPV